MGFLVAGRGVRRGNQRENQRENQKGNSTPKMLSNIRYPTNGLPDRNMERSKHTNGTSLVCPCLEAYFFWVGLKKKRLSIKIGYCPKIMGEYGGCPFCTGSLRAQEISRHTQSSHPFARGVNFKRTRTCGHHRTTEATLKRACRDRKRKKRRCY